MGRELADVHLDDKPNGGPRISEDIESNSCEVKECTAENSGNENVHGKKDILGVKSANFCTDLPEEKNEKAGDQKSSSNKKLSSPSSKSSSTGNTHLRHPPSKAVSKGTVDVISTPSSTATKNSEPSSPLTPVMSRKPLHSYDRKHPDEEDNWSVASSTAASVRTARSRVTIGTAPTFKSAKRAEKRREFYQKLEEKHQALEEEKSQCEARTKEEQETAIRQLRKSMVVKANPIPSFYYEGPPPKVELKKLPLTRPKSPNLTRRKSCGDAVHSSATAKTCCRTHRHSLDSSHRQASSTSTSNVVKSKGQVGGQSGNGAVKAQAQARVKQVKEMTKAAPTKITEQSNANITVYS